MDSAESVFRLRQEFDGLQDGFVEEPIKAGSGSGFLDSYPLVGGGT